MYIATNPFCPFGNWHLPKPTFLTTYNKTISSSVLELKILIGCPQLFCMSSDRTAWAISDFILFTVAFIEAVDIEANSIITGLDWGR